MQAPANLEPVAIKLSPAACPAAERGTAQASSTTPAMTAKPAPSTATNGWAYGSVAMPSLLMSRACRCACQCAWGAPVAKGIYQWLFARWRQPPTFFVQPATSGKRILYATQDSEYKVLLNWDTTCEVYFEPKGLYPNWKVDYVKVRTQNSGRESKQARLWRRRCASQPQLTWCQQQHAARMGLTLPL